MEINRKYLEAKSEIIFGKRMMFLLASDVEKTTPDDGKNIKYKNKSDLKERQVSDDPFEDVIINDLGGVKIN